MQEQTDNSGRDGNFKNQKCYRSKALKYKWNGFDGLIVDWLCLEKESQCFKICQ